MPGAEMVEAVNIASAHNIPIAMCDRDVRLTLKRAWRSTPFFKKLILVSTLVGSVFAAPKVSEENVTGDSATGCSHSVVGGAWQGLTDAAASTH